MSAAAPTLSANDRAIALWEIASVMVSTLIAEWAVSTFADNARLIAAVPIVFALGLMIFSHRQRRESLRELGFRADNFWPAVRLLLFPTLFAVMIIAAGSWLLRDGVGFRPVRIRLAFIPLWALFQQYALQGYANRRAQIWAGQGAIAALIVAAVFAVLHLPSPLLAMLAFAGGFVWASVYQRYPNLLALALSHTVVSWTLSLMIPDSLTRHLRIGFKYFGLDI